CPRPMTVKFEHFAKTGSWMEQLDPRWKLAALFPAALATAFLRHWPAASAALATALFIAAVARLPPRWFLKRVGAAVLLVVPFALLLPFLHGEGPRWEIGPLMVSVLGVEAGLVILLK